MVTTECVLLPRPLGYSGGGASLVPHAMEPTSSASCKEASQRSRVASASHMEVTKQLVHKAGIADEVA